MYQFVARPTFTFALLACTQSSGELLDMAEHFVKDGALARPYHSLEGSSSDGASKVKSRTPKHTACGGLRRMARASRKWRGRLSTTHWRA